MRRFALTLALALGTLSLPSAALAAPIYLQIANTWSQQGLTITDQPGPLELWDTHLAYGNFTPDVLHDVRFWGIGVTINGEQAQWDDTTHVGTTASSLTWTEANATSHRDIGLSNFAVPAGYSLNANSTLPTWTYGDLGPGQIADIHIQILVSDAANVVFFPGFGFTQTVPEPSSLLLLGSGLALLARRRLQFQR